MRTWQELLAAAEATGTYALYQGDGATVPWEIAAEYSALAGQALYEYKAHLDSSYPEAFRLHDWCYTPYGTLIGCERLEADNAMRDMIYAHATQAAVLDSGICWLAVRTAGEPYFGNSQVGFDSGLFRQVTGVIWRFRNGMKYKYTIGLSRIQGQPAAAFTETWYLEAATDEEAATAVKNYAATRATVLSNSWEVGTFQRLARMRDNCKRFKPQGADQFCCVPRTEGPVACLCPTPIKGKLGVGDQGWDGILIEYCTEPFNHTGCSKCESLRRAIVRQFIMRGIPDAWYEDGVMKPPVLERAKIRGFAEAYIKNILHAGSVACDDACTDSETSACTSVLFRPFTGVCVQDQRAVKRSTGRLFFQTRGRRSSRSQA